MEEAADNQRRREEKKQQRRQAATAFRQKRATIKVLEQELKLIGMGAILYW
jgi:hypothetical protein